MSQRLLSLLACLGIAAPLFAQKPDTDYFEKKVRPLLVAKCVQCHGLDKAKGRLRLDNAEGFGKGGDSGPVVVPGKPEESLLVGSSRVDLQACKLEYSIVSPK